MATQDSNTTDYRSNPNRKLSSFDECSQIREGTSVYSLYDAASTRLALSEDLLAQLITTDCNKSTVEVGVDLLWLIQRQIDEAKNLYDLAGDILKKNNCLSLQ